MKKIVLGSFFGFLSVTAIGQATVPNSSFESWYDMGVKDSLDYWYTSTLQYQSQGWLDVNNSHEIAASHSGTKAIHLETVLHFDAGSGENDTLFGYAIKEAADGSGFHGFPYSDTVDVFTCWYKSGIVAGDMGVIIIELYNTGTTFSSATYPIIGSQSTWTQLTIPLPGGSTEVPDSVFVGFASSDPFNPGVAAPGSWLEIDDCDFDFLAGSAVPSAIPNNGFENWTYLTVEQPSGWFTFDQLMYPMTLNAYATKSTTASLGTYSMQIETTFENIMIGIPSIATNGYFEPVLDSVIGGTPFIAQPAQASGMYQFNPTFTDTAYVFMDFWNATSGVHNMFVDTLLDASVWTPWSIDLTFPEAPDSVLIYFWGGQNLGSTLLVDDLKFTGGDVSVSENSYKNSFVIFPNPASSSFVVRFTEADQIRMFDLTGKLITTINVTETNLTEINTSDLENGVYLIQLINAGKTTSQKVVIQH